MVFGAVLSKCPLNLCMSFLSLVTYTHLGFGLGSVLATCLMGIFSETRIFEITNPKCWHDNFSVKSFSDLN